MNQLFWDFIGLGLIVAGAILLFRFAMPYETFGDTGDAVTAADTTSHELAKERRYKWFGYLGIALVLLGIAFMAWGGKLVK
jgi:uncharacterized membrane protein YdcZ (DUF606 family)